MSSQKKRISLTLDDSKDIINSIEASIVYLENCKSRFKLLHMPFYLKEIDKGILRLNELRNIFISFSNKFDDSNFITDYDISNIFKLLALSD